MIIPFSILICLGLLLSALIYETKRNWNEADYLFKVMYIVMMWAIIMAMYIVCSNIMIV